MRKNSKERFFVEITNLSSNVIHMLKNLLLQIKGLENTRIGMGIGCNTAQERERRDGLCCCQAVMSLHTCHERKWTYSIDL